MKKIKKILKDIFIYEPKIAKILKEYEQKEKIKQQKSKVKNRSTDKSNNERDWQKGANEQVN